MRFKFLDWLTIKINNLTLAIQNWGMRVTFGGSASKAEKKWFKGKFKKK